MLFFKNKEQQSLIDSSRRALKNAEKKIEERNKLIKDMQEEMERIVQQLKEENANLRYEIDEAKDRLRRINIVVTKNKYEDEEVLKETIKELTSDYQSIS